MRDIAVVGFAQSPSVRRAPDRNEVEILMPVVAAAIKSSGVPKEKIGFTCSGSCDYLAGQPFAFVWGLEAIGAWPPIRESHVEADGAWALYEAWVLMQEGEIDAALVYGFGKSSPGQIRDVGALQLDPYYVAPLWPDTVSLAALQARACLDAGLFTEEDMEAVARRARADGATNLNAQLVVPVEPAGSFIASPLRPHDCAPVSDGAAAVVLAAGDLARAVSQRPAWIKGIDHRIEPQALGARDLTTSSSTSTAARASSALADKLDIAELYAPFTSQELILRRSIGLNGTQINPSGGALVANPIMAAGLIRIGEAATRITNGDADRALAHATSGPCLQQNLVAVLEGE
jgi:acetyl-CoA acetyltransferase